MARYEEITIDQGSDVSIELHVINSDGAARDITNHEFAAKLKKNYNSDSDDTTDFTTAVSNAAAGIVTLSLTNTQSGLLKAGRYVYDVEMTYYDSDEAATIERILEGKITVTPSVTR